MRSHSLDRNSIVTNSFKYKLLTDFSPELVLQIIRKKFLKTKNSYWIKAEESTFIPILNIK